MNRMCENMCDHIELKIHKSSVQKLDSQWELYFRNAAFPNENKTVNPFVVCYNQGGYVFIAVRLSLSRITQEQHNQFSRNLVEGKVFSKEEAIHFQGGGSMNYFSLSLSKYNFSTFL